TPADIWGDPAGANPLGGNVVIKGRVVIRGGGKVVIGGRDITAGPPLNVANRTSVPIYLRPGEKPANSLREISGVIPAEALVLDRLVTVDGILKAVGQTLKGKKGGEISIKAVEQHKDGDVTVRLTLANLPAEEVRPGPALPPGLVIVRDSAPQQRAKADMP